MIITVDGDRVVFYCNKMESLLIKDGLSSLLGNRGRSEPWRLESACISLQPIVDYLSFMESPKYREYANVEGTQVFIYTPYEKVCHAR